MLQNNILVYNGKHCHVINTSNLCHVLLKKYIDIIPQRLYSDMMCFLFMFTVGQWGSSSITLGLTSMTTGSGKRQKVTYELATNAFT